MTHPNLDELDRVRFMWPEPLVIELIRDQYAGRIPDAQLMPVVKLHQIMLRGLLEPTGFDRVVLRRQLLAQCGGTSLDAYAIAAIDHAVFLELMRLVGMRFRNSPRLREAFSEQLQAAVAQIPAVVRPEPKRAFRVGPPPVSRWSRRAVAA